MKLTNQIKAKDGSGGTYLSNEIFYRVALLRKNLRPFLPTGHFNIEKLQRTNEDFSTSKTKDMLNIVKTAIENGIKGI